MINLSYEQWLMFAVLCLIIIWFLDKIPRVRLRVRRTKRVPYSTIDSMTIHRLMEGKIRAIEFSMEGTFVQMEEEE
jgi:hypothetical protein